MKLLLKIVAWAVGSIIVIAGLFIVFILLRWESSDGRPVPDLKAPTDSASIARGEHIFKYQAGCWGCHGSPESADKFSPSGGFPFDLTNVGPGFGVWYARNITPDVETGIGGWSDGEVVQALREGIRKGGAPLFPIMPIDWYHDLADDDVHALVAYLRTIPPVRNAVPDRAPSFVAKALFTFGVMGPKPPVTGKIVAPPRGVTPEYGKYVSSQLAGCADCHTPRNLQDGKFYTDSLFAGSSFPFGGGAEGPLVTFARNITPHQETGIGSWSDEQFFDAVTSGMRPDSTVLGPIMPYSMYKFWDPADIAAVRAYIKTLTPVNRTVPPASVEPMVAESKGAERGGHLFLARCQICHGKNGMGAPPTNVTLAEVAPGFTDADLKDFIRNGQLNLHMPAFGKTLKEEELDDVIAHIRGWKAN